MQVFRFRQFSVRNEMSAQKVGTDGVLLGAAATLPGTSDGRMAVLDIGTGTGLVALMLAQRLFGLGKGFNITGIDIDAPSVAEAAANFAASPWAGSLSAVQVSLNAYASPAPLGLIVSNPPFYDNSLPAPEGRRNSARHTDTLSFKEICAFAGENLTSDGRLSMILPAADERGLLRYAASFGLFPAMLLRIRTVASKPPRRLIAEFVRSRADASDSRGSEGRARLQAASQGVLARGVAATVAEDGGSASHGRVPTVLERELTLMEDGHRTPAYSALTADFYL